MKKIILVIMKKTIKYKNITAILAVLVVLTSLVFYACKEDILNINEPGGIGTKDAIFIVDDIKDLGEAPVCYFRFYTKVDDGVNSKRIFHGFNASPSNADWTGYDPKYLKINGQNWPITKGGAYQFLSTGANGYIEDINVVMEYNGGEFKWNMKNPAEIDFEIKITDTIEIDRNKPFTIKYSGGNYGADTTKLLFNCISEGIYNRIVTQDNGNIVISPNVLKQFPVGLHPIALGIGRYTEADTQYEGREVRIDIDNIQGTAFMARFK